MSLVLVDILEGLTGSCSWTNERRVQCSFSRDPMDAVDNSFAFTDFLGKVRDAENSMRQSIDRLEQEKAELSVRGCIFRNVEIFLKLFSIVEQRIGAAKANQGVRA